MKQQISPILSLEEQAAMVLKLQTLHMQELKLTLQVLGLKILQFKILLP